MRNLYTELAEYTGRPQTLVEARCQHASVELAWQFEKHKNDPLAHYRESDLYIFALTRYQMAIRNAGIHQWYKNNIIERGWKTGLDYGGGIGEQTILGIEAGAKMTYLDVMGSKTLEYATWRFRNRQILGFIGSVPETYKINEDYDFIVAMDVFEHMEHPQPVIEELAKRTKYIFCNPTEIQYNWLYPQHISHFTLDPYFTKIDNYLFKRKGVV